MPALLDASGLTKSYGPVTAVAGVDFTLAENSYVTLLGPSGCGKTSILRMIGGFEAVSAGALRLDGARLDHVPAARRPINTVFQSYALFPHLSVLENVGFGLAYRDMPRGRIAERAREVLKTVQMEHLSDRRPSQLSGGQQQRVALARAIVNEPRLLLLDEPLSALDRRMRRDMQVELKALQRRLGMAFLHVTHDQEEAFALSDTIIVMRDGRIEQQGRPDDIYARPRTAWVADFIGGATCVPGRITTRSGDSAMIDTALGAFTCPASPEAGREAGAGADIGTEIGAENRAVLCLRPEQLGLADTGIPATVTHCVYRGADWLVECRAGDLALRATHADTPPAPGTTVALRFDPARAWIAA